VQNDVKQIGVMVAQTPIGPWTDPLGCPLIKSCDFPEGYDPAIFQESDQTSYLVFGAFDYYIAKLSEDMISLDESPRRLEVICPQGPYGESTDDKAFLHKKGKYYYLSWGAYYAMSEEIYGPYHFKGQLIDINRVELDFKEPTWPNGIMQGRHGSFFEWHNQDYFIYCDLSQGNGNRYFRDSWISYVNYRSDGTIDPIFINECAVGRYYPSKGAIKAWTYFSGSNADKRELDGDFSVEISKDESTLSYPNIISEREYHSVSLIFASMVTIDATVFVSIRSHGTSYDVCLVVSDKHSESNVLVIPFEKKLRVEDIKFTFKGFEKGAYFSEFELM
jgi:hypothetical protein